MTDVKSLLIIQLLFLVLAFCILTEIRITFKMFYYYNIQFIGLNEIISYRLGG